MSSPPEMKRASQKGQGVEVKEDDDDDDDADDDDVDDDDDDDHINRQNHLKLRFQSIHVQIHILKNKSSVMQVNSSFSCLNRSGFRKKHVRRCDRTSRD